MGLQNTNENEFHGFGNLAIWLWKGFGNTLKGGTEALILPSILEVIEHLSSKYVFHKKEAYKKSRLEQKVIFLGNKLVSSLGSTIFAENLLTRWQLGGHIASVSPLISATDPLSLTLVRIVYKNDDTVNLRISPPPSNKPPLKSYILLISPPRLYIDC